MMTSSEKPIVGRVSFISGETQEFTDANEYLTCIREEMPYAATSGFRFRTLTRDLVVRKAVDDIVYDFYGEENTHTTEDYKLDSSEGLRMSGM